MAGPGSLNTAQILTIRWACLPHASYRWACKHSPPVDLVQFGDAGLYLLLAKGTAPCQRQQQWQLLLQHEPLMLHDEDAS